MPAVEALEQGRAYSAQRAWRAAHAALTSADADEPLGAADLELLATTAYMLGRDDEYLEVLARAHQRHLDDGEPRRAARAAFWIGMQLIVGGEIGRGTGWIGRAERVLEREPGECAERGLLLMPGAFVQEARGDYDAAAAVAAEAAAVGDRFGDRDLCALARHSQGHFLVLGGRLDEGLRLLDEAMVAVTTGELSPIPTGIVYCGVIMACQLAHEPRRAREWTAALARWCERQPDMVAFSGRCHVHRAEIRQLEGAWSDALDEARAAARRAALGNHRRALGEAAYIQGEVHRLRGRHDRAEEAYREAATYGREPQPGLALLRLAQGRLDAAVAAIRRALAETSDAPRRAVLLPACAEIRLAAGDLEGARAASEELAGIATGREAVVLGAMADHTRGAIDLAAGDAEAALPALRRAFRAWDDVGAPYEAARARLLIGAACRALGDEDAACVELDAARAVFVSLGATTDLARADALAGSASGGAADAAGLTARELEVLRLLAAGRTNKAIAAELVLSDRTVDRHVSNIFAKLGVASRAAATAYAYEHELVG
jgi:ATP/maltotriose-dependent transcriptional regulator MalT